MVRMADKEVIALGEKLNRLVMSEDFFPLASHISARTEYLKDQIAAQASTTNCNPAIVSHLAQRIDELDSLSSWLSSAIEDGGREKIKSQQEDSEKETDFVAIR